MKSQPMRLCRTKTFIFACLLFYARAFLLSPKRRFSRVCSLPSTSLTENNAYTVADCLGKGSFGVVHFIEPNRIGKRPWTWQELEEQHPTLTAEQIKDKAQRCQSYFDIEVHCLQKLSSDRIVPYCGVQVIDKQKWMLFEVVTGRAAPHSVVTTAPSLGDMLERDRLEQQANRKHHLCILAYSLGVTTGPDDPIAPEESFIRTVDVVINNVLHILTVIHAEGIVHRDIKPGNLLVADGKLVLIDFGSAADLTTAGPFKANIGLSDRVAISPVYVAPEIFIDPSNRRAALTFDCFSAGLLICQLLFGFLDERTESGFHQQFAAAKFNLDAWLYQLLQGKVRPAGLVHGLEVLRERRGLWTLLQNLLQEDPRDRISSAEALEMWTGILDQSIKVDDGDYLEEVLEALDVCLLPPVVQPLHFVATFRRSESLGLILAEADADTSDMDESSLRKWKQAIADAAPGEVFVQDTVSGGQADEMGIFEIGDRLQGVGELPLAFGGFEKAVAMIRDQPASSKFVTLHFDRKSASRQRASSGFFPFPATDAPIVVADQGAWSSRGRRPAQEDTFVLHEVHDTKDRSIVLAGVMDGHLGKAASTHVQQRLPEFFSELLLTADGSTVEEMLARSWDFVCDSYRDACSAADACVADYDSREGVLEAFTSSADATAGTTTSVAALDLHNSHLVMLNCGDSRGLVISTEGNLIFETNDHTPEFDFERLSVGHEQGLGYEVPECNIGRWTVGVGDYTYAVARSLEGPFATSRGIISDPDVDVVQVEPGATVLIATDGLWEILDSAQVAQLITMLRKRNMLSAGDAAKALCSIAIEKGSQDNVSVVILYLE